MTVGFHGKMLAVDLTGGATERLDISTEDVATHFLGSGLAAKLLYEALDPAVDALAAESPLLFLCGLFTGSPLPGTTKVSVCGRSPLTGIWNEAIAGGHWPTELRRTGFDGIRLVGRAETPVYLYLSNDEVALRPAGDLWGLDTYALERALRPAIGKKAKIAAIGPAGEHGLPIASVVFDAPVSRIAGRGGLGAVMGAKHLKAIVVDGDPRCRVDIADLEGLKQRLRQDSEVVREKTKALRIVGTSGGVTTVEHNGELPIKNWQLGAWEDGAERITGQTIQPEYLDRHYACYACPTRCGKIYRHEERELHGHGPEFETLGMLGSNCLNDDPEAVIEANELCNRYGLDTISTGGAIAFAIEAFERGILGPSDTGGKQLGWNGATVVDLVHQIGTASGIGALLGQGTRRAAAEIGGTAPVLAVHTKGMEYPAHDPRGHVSMALNYATAVRGACHLEGLTFFLDRGVQVPDFGYLEAPDQFESDDKPPIVVNMQNYMSVFNPLGICKFMFIGGVGPSTIAEWLRLYSGIDLGTRGVLTVGERLFNLKRMYDCRLGIRREDDVLPPRLRESKPDGAAKGVVPNLEKMLPEYYELRGWRPDGVPSSEKLAELGIAEPG